MRLALTLCLALVAAPALAQGPDRVSEEELCASFGEMAQAIMGARQAGVSLSASLKIANEADEGDRELVRSIVMAAYERPAFSTQAYQDREAAEFGNQMHLTCLKARGL